MDNIIEEIIARSIVGVCIWITINSPFTFIGMFEGIVSPYNRCNTKLNKRIEYILPGYTFGCWLTEEINLKKD